MNWFTVLEHFSRSEGEFSAWGKFSWIFCRSYSWRLNFDFIHSQFKNETVDAQFHFNRMWTLGHSEIVNGKERRIHSTIPPNTFDYTNNNNCHFIQLERRVPRFYVIRLYQKSRVNWQHLCCSSRYTSTTDTVRGVIVYALIQRTEFHFWMNFSLEKIIFQIFFRRFVVLLLSFAIDKYANDSFVLHMKRRTIASIATAMRPVEKPLLSCCLSFIPREYIF